MYVLFLDCQLKNHHEVNNWKGTSLFSFFLNILFLVKTLTRKKKQQIKKYKNNCFHHHRKIIHFPGFYDVSDYADYMYILFQTYFLENTFVLH